MISPSVFSDEVDKAPAWDPSKLNSESVQLASSYLDDLRGLEILPPTKAKVFVVTPNKLFTALDAEALAQMLTLVKGRASSAAFSNLREEASKPYSHDADEDDGLDTEGTPPGRKMVSIESTVGPTEISYLPSKMKGSLRRCLS